MRVSTSTPAESSPYEGTTSRVWVYVRGARSFSPNAKKPLLPNVEFPRSGSMSVVDVLKQIES